MCIDSISIFIRIIREKDWDVQIRGRDAIGWEITSIHQRKILMLSP